MIITSASFASLFHLDALAILMTSLALFIGVCVASFAYRYLQGDAHYGLFFLRLLLLMVLISIMVCADHFAILFGAWCLSNALLVRLMIHKPGWMAARASGRLAARNHGFGAMCLAASLILFYGLSGETSLQSLLHHHPRSPLIPVALLLLLLAAMAQSAIWPFHRWLISSANSPTPVSALMHAGLVNGGGFLLARFAPVYLEYPYLLTTLFAIGMVSAFLGTWWKLLQSDVKRMLACSTLGQMGFMMAQCGLGLFPAAVAHLILHGLFKAYLFLGSGSAAQEKRFAMDYPLTCKLFIYAFICGAVGSCSFAWASGQSWLAGDTTLVLMLVALLACSQCALNLLTQPARSTFFLALLGTNLFGLAYGISVYSLTLPLKAMGFMQPQALNSVYWIGMLLLLLPWLARLVWHQESRHPAWHTWQLQSYVLALNASQPDSQTITAHRNHYQY